MSEVQVVKYEVVDGVGVITVGNPAVNALGLDRREGMSHAVEQGNADPRVAAFARMGHGHSVIAGADIRQFGKTRPMDATVSAAALDASAERALACHYRTGTSDVKVGPPQLPLGIVPGGGGTQRLPWLIGLVAALELVVRDQHVTAEEARKLGILDEVARERSLCDDAIFYAKQVAAVPPLPRAHDKADRIARAKADPATAALLRKPVCPDNFVGPDCSANKADFEMANI